MEEEYIDKELFEKRVAAIFEENCLHGSIKQETFENVFIFCINYCLDNKSH